MSFSAVWARGLRASVAVALWGQEFMRVVVRARSLVCLSFTAGLSGCRPLLLLLLPWTALSPLEAAGSGMIYFRRLDTQWSHVTVTMACPELDYGGKTNGLLVTFLGNELLLI